MNADSMKSTQRWQASVPFGRWILTVSAAASFACLLTLIATGATDRLAEIAIVCFAASVPLVGHYVLVLSDESRGHHSSVLMRVIAGLGLLLFFIGFVTMLFRVSALAAGCFFLFSISMVFVLTSSQDRAARAAVQ